MAHPWLTEHSEETQGVHDISAGLRENYRKRWKSAIAAVRASTKFRTFAALASESRAESQSSLATGEATESSSSNVDGGAGFTQDPGKISPPTKRELYSEDEDEEDEEGEANEWFDTEDGSAAKNGGAHRRQQEAQPQQHRQGRMSRRRRKGSWRRSKTNWEACILGLRLTSSFLISFGSRYCFSSLHPCL